MNISKELEDEKNKAFNTGAHQAMQETRLEIALGLIKQVANEELVLEGTLGEAVLYIGVALARFRATSECRHGRSTPKTYVP